MKHAVIVAHPEPKSFNLHVAGTYCEAVRSRGHEVMLRDLYRLQFDPLLKSGELPRPGRAKPEADVVTERQVIADADVFVFIYPLWFNAPPAMVKGYMDRVFGMGFGFGPIHQGGNEPLLTGKSLLSFTTSGAPTEWLRQEGGLAALRNLYDEHFAAVCGLRLLDHIHLGGIGAMMAPAAVERRIAEVPKAVERLFKERGVVVRPAFAKGTS
jgi:NAD(P)H dehydrogenase (quinone)